MTAWQISALAAVGRGWHRAWLHGASVEVCWVTYTIATTQYGFIPGGMPSIAMQVYSFMNLRSTRSSPSRPPRSSRRWRSTYVDD